MATSKFFSVINIIMSSTLNILVQHKEYTSSIKYRFMSQQNPQFYNPSDSILNPSWATIHYKLVVQLGHANYNTVLRPNKRRLQFL